MSNDILKKSDDKLKQRAPMRSMKFICTVDKSDNTTLDMISSKLLEANKDHAGEKISFTDLAIFAIQRLNDKDLIHLKSQCFTDSKLSDIAIDHYNKVNNTTLNKDQLILNLLKVNKSKLISDSLTN